MNDDLSQDVSTPVQTSESASTPVEPESSQPNGSTPNDLPPEAPESPTSDSTNVPVEDPNPGVNQPESEGTNEPIFAPNEPETPVDDQPTSANDSPQVSEPVQPPPLQSAPVSAPTALTPSVPQSQSPAQQDQTGFIRALLAKAQAKIQSNKQKKLDKIILFAQKKKIIANEDVQKLLHVSSATATRYMVKLVQQGRLTRVGNPRDAKYQFVR
jgi:hypothetical protein